MNQSHAFPLTPTIVPTDYAIRAGLSQHLVVVSILAVLFTSRKRLKACGTIYFYTRIRYQPTVLFLVAVP
jgi:hypothetical protein